MENSTKTIIVKTSINAPIEKVWKFWTEPEHIKNWNHASDDWMTSHVDNNLQVGGKFLSRMEAKDGSFSFDFSGTYDEIENYKTISYTLDDARKVNISFSTDKELIKVEETFEAETVNGVEMQQQGWQSILDNFKKYVESK